MPHFAIFSAAAASLGCILFAWFFMKAYRQKNHRLAFWLKGGAAVCFVCTAAMLRLDIRTTAFGSLVLTGLIFGLIGDQLLAMRFLFTKYHDVCFGAGALSFSLGHYYYMKALFGLGTIRLPVLAGLFLLGSLAGGLYTRRHGTNAGSKQWAVVVYLALVIFMAAVAGTAFLTLSTVGTCLIALGGICFAASDCILIAYSFGKAPAWSMNIWVHITYYAAQLLIAWSTLWI